MKASHSPIGLSKKKCKLLSDKLNTLPANCQLSDYIRGQEKLTWMHSSYLAK